MLSKAELRATLKAKRTALTEQWQMQASAEVHLRLGAALKPEVRRVLAYFALPGEPNLAAVFADAWRAGIELLLPRVAGRTEMDFYSVKSMDDLVAGPHGLREPGRQCLPIDPAKLGIGDVMLVPGLGFDGEGWRLGFGAGYYDRYLARCGTGLTTIGVCFDAFVVDGVPHDELDQPVDALCTEQSRWDCSRKADEFPAKS